MADSINWIHITDLHLGLDNDSWLWPKVKHDFFKDLEVVSDEVDGWDLVFFTGDFVQKGDKSEFERLNKELDSLWKIISKSGRVPKLCVVPGNHDLVRPLSDSAIAKAMTQIWWKDSELRAKFWRDPTDEFRKAVNGFFENYSEWISNSSVPLLDRKVGTLPGDFSAIFTKGNSSLGIVGLNTTFLQIAAGDFKNKLDVHISQLNAVCDGDPVLWLRKQTANILLTHQPPSWLAPEALDDFRQEIYPAGRFFAQFCGHQHEPESSETSEAGAAPRRLRQGPSLFGLENWDEVTPQKRIHGYTGGQFIFNGSDGYEKFWPRITVKGRHGGLNFGPDSTFKLQKGDCVVTDLELETDQATSSDAVVEPLSQQNPLEANSLALQLFGALPDEQSSKSKLAACPKLSLVASQHHKFVRQDEQSQFETEMRKSRLIWLVADWGTGKEGFLGSCLERFKDVQMQLPEAFHLRCGDASDIEVFESLFPQQFGLSLQAFCSLAAQLSSSFLILDEIHPELSKGEKLSGLARIARAITDYCPNLKLIMISRLRPEGSIFPFIELHPLDVPDARVYINLHPEATGELKDAEVIEKLHDRSEGLPMHLDRMIKELKVCSLASVLEAGWEGSTSVEGGSEETPKALIHAVTSIAKSEDRHSKRSFRLLKVLSALPYGETIEALGHYLPTEPFFAKNALQLSDLALLDVIPLLQSNPQITWRTNTNSESAPKLLKVPRQVRDYVQTLIVDNERAEMIFAGMDRFFGRGWRQGKVKLRSQPTEYKEYLNSGAGNEFALIHHVVSLGRDQNNLALIKKGIRLGIHYSRHLKALERYRDLATVAGALLQITDQASFTEEWADLASLYGEGLRMLGKQEQALKYLKDALDSGQDYFPDDKKAAIWLDIALAEQKLPNAKAAINAAEQIKKLAKPKAGAYLHAESIIAEECLEGDERKKKLAELEEKARAAGYEILAETIALDLASASDTPTERIRFLDKVIANKERGYNQARAIVSKAEAVQSLDPVADLTQSELLSLCSAYSYLYAQRFSNLFDRCHAALWQILERQGDIHQLLRLFRHTSFVWRIRGEDAKEADYLKRLNDRKIQEDGAKGLVIEVRYFMQRLRIVIVDTLKLPK